MKEAVVRDQTPGIQLANFHIVTRVADGVQPGQEAHQPDDDHKYGPQRIDTQPSVESGDLTGRQNLAALGRGAAYVGMIGSLTKVDLMRREFLDKGWATEEEWGRVRAPIGLEIGSKTVEEIAVNIAAELVRVRAGLAAKGREKP